MFKCSPSEAMLEIPDAATVSYRRNPRGYWDDFANVKRELLTFIEDRETPGVVPTNEKLIKAGRGDLARAVLKYGGYQSVAERLGLAYSQRRQGYWDDFANVERELLGFIKEHGVPGVVPMNKELKRAGRGDLIKAIVKHGGHQAIAERLGFTHSRKRQGYWDDFANVERELLDFIREHGTPGVMPTQEELKKAGRSSLAMAITKSGGHQSVAGRLGLSSDEKRPKGYWDDFANVERELLDFIKGHGTPGVMPTSVEIYKMGRSSLAFGISIHGGYQAVAERLKLTCARKQPGYWEDFANVKRGIFAFIKEHGTPGIMPTHDKLIKAERSTLAYAVQKHGGYPAVAKRLNLELIYTAKPSGYWDDFAHVERELLAFIEKYGSPRRMPTQEELKKAERGGLIKAINRHGGKQSVAERLGLVYSKKRQGYWDDFANVERELLAFIEEYGSPGRMPTQEELVKTGHGDLVNAMGRHGGQQSVAHRLGLIYSNLTG